MAIASQRKAGPGRNGAIQLRMKMLFFDSAAVTKAMNAADRKALSKFGAFVRTDARDSLRMAKQKTLGQLTSRQRMAYDIAAHNARIRGEPRPRKPEATAVPGEPPRLHVRPRGSNPLRKLIFFGYDIAKKSVVIGPLPYKGARAAKLEHGSGGYHKFPFMAPAMAKELPILPKLYENSVRL